MIELVNSLPLWIGLVLTVFLVSALGLVVFWLFHWLLSTRADDATHGLANSLFQVVAVMLALMLSLAFNDVISQRREIDDSVKLEAARASDVLAALARLESEDANGARVAMLNYLQHAVDSDWPALKDDQLSPQADAAFEQVVGLVFALEPTSGPDEERQIRMLDDLDSMSDSRQARLNSAQAQSPVYAYSTLVGFLITLALLGTVYDASPTILGLLALYAAFVGLILYIIVAMSDPFQGGLRIDPEPLRHLIEVQLTNSS